MKILLLIGTAGFFGSLLRFFCTKALASLLPGFPWGTLAVNVLGAAAAGFCFVWLNARFPQYAAYFPVFFVGFLGAFTTFSSFALESVRFLADAQWGKFVCNVILQNATGIAAAFGGFQLARRLLHF
ncbi:MAG: CrcB family protein [Victivallaceae bacterium]|nr:CrcB family protein [Victivallaceae bacterium]